MNGPLLDGGLMMPIASSGLMAGGGLDRLEQLRLEGLNGSALGDDELLAQYQAGHREALDEIFRRYRLLAYRVAYRLLGNEADALDAVQEAFVKALTHLPSFQGRSSFKTWLLRVVSNASLDLGRHRGRREVLRLDLVQQNDNPDKNLTTEDH